MVDPVGHGATEIGTSSTSAFHTVGISTKEVLHEAFVPSLGGFQQVRALDHPAKYVWQVLQRLSHTEGRNVCVCACVRGLSLSAPSWIGRKPEKKIGMKSQIQIEEKRKNAWGNGGRRWDRGLKGSNHLEQQWATFDRLPHECKDACHCSCTAWLPKKAYTHPYDSTRARLTSHSVHYTTYISAPYLSFQSHLFKSIILSVTR